MPKSNDISDLRELAHLLRKDRLFILAEQESVEQLTSEVAALSATLAQYSWIASQQRKNLQRLVLARQDCHPALRAQRDYSMERLRFLEAGPVLGYVETATYGEFLAALRNSPELLAGCLTSGDRNHPERIPGIINTLCAGLFGSCLLGPDKRLVLRLLRQLAELQLAPSENPRRLLRHGTCAFARMYSTFHENLHTAQLFLTAALHEPIMTLLAEDEEFLDVDPEKAALWDSPETETPNQRATTVDKLVSLTESFVRGLEDNIYCFPPSVCWLLRQLVSILTKANILLEKEIYELCTDLLLTHFICPAIVNPEPHGIIEAPVNRVARFNLMQVAKILQNLALRKFEEVDAKVQDLYSHFQPDCVSRIISRILDGESNAIEIPFEGETDLETVPRYAVLLSTSQLNALVSFFQTELNSGDDCFDKQQLEGLLANLPAFVTNGHRDTAQTKPADVPKKSGLLPKGLVRVKSQPNGDATDEAVTDSIPEPVLVFKLPGELEEELLSETKVLEMESKIDPVPVRCQDGQDLPDSAETSQSQEKRTRFSLSHDEGSIGNTSDNLEAISEAASNHSGASSLESEGEDQNDNLSDMVSANVSGRGSPNISGRDTPSSQITEGEPVDRSAPVQEAVSKQSRSDIDDKFCKFEIRTQQVLGDETVSMVSDTWSTDVLASDSETVGDVDRFSRPLDEGPPHPFIQHSLDISETASEAWSTDVMASDSERMTEVDTDDTASVARSDDTAASEPGGRGDEPDTPPPIVFRCGDMETPPSAIFRPIARHPRSEELDPPRMSLTVPPSPTRGPDHGHSNVTGRGGAKADYKRRTMEFIGAVSKPHSLASLESPRMIHVIDRMETSGRGGSVRGRISSRPTSNQANSVPDDVASLDASFSGLRIAHSADPVSTPAEVNTFDEATPPASLTNSFKPGASGFGMPSKFAESKGKLETEDGVFKSSTSLASSSSSGSNHAAAQMTPPVPSDVKMTIPKSISFDKTADKDFLDDKKQKKGFFGNLKMSFKNRKMKKGDINESESSGFRVRRVMSEDSRMNNGGNIEVDDILAKYRGKGGEDRETRPKRRGSSRECTSREARGLSEEGLFFNAKRKLRIVFSRADMQSWPASALRENELVEFLKLQLAEARSLQNRDLVSQLHETLRCVKLFDADGCRRLVAELRTDLHTRAAYATYLTRVRQALLSRAARLTSLTARVRVESRLTEAFLIGLCARLFLERREDLFRQFAVDFRNLSLADEKTDLLDAFLSELSAEMDRDPVWLGTSEEQRSEAEAAVRTSVHSRVYPYAFYPNGDGDISRDQVLFDHIKKLADIITPNHKDLQIPLRYHGECPWPSAQAELLALASYKTPRDKVTCVVRCADTIMNLLALASEGSVPAADEFLPVLIYVIIAANPPGLLSTVQYVHSFYRNISGADLYYWMQFCSAIELIKTMDYNV